MGLFSDYASAEANTTAVQAGGVDFGTKFGGTVAGAVVSGLQSFYNTGVAVGNALGADAEEASTFNTLRDLDENWANYYQENSQGIDALGFVGTSLIPGLAAIKGLNAFRTGANVGAVGRGLNFARSQQAVALSAALDEMAIQGGSAFSRVNKNMLKGMAWGTAEQVLQAGVFELAVAATMKRSPLLADEGMWDIAKNVMWGAAVGGGIGGTIESLVLNSSIKQAAKKVSLAENQFKVFSGLKNLDLAEGDKAYELIKEIVNLPKNVETTAVDFAKEFPQVAAAGKSTVRDMQKYFTNTLKGAEGAALNDFQISLRKLVGGESALSGGGDSQAADALVGWMMKRFEATKSGTAATASEDLGDLLHQLRKVTPATDTPLYSADELLYFKKALSPEERAKFEEMADWKDAIVRSTPHDKNAYEKPYVFTGKEEDWNSLSTVRIGSKETPTLTAAWDQGHHVAIQADGTMRINPKSNWFKRVDDPVLSSRRFVNTRTGAFTEDVMLTAADRAAAGKTMQVSSWGVEIPRADGNNIRIAMSGTLRAEGDVTYRTARHAWASQLSEKDLMKFGDIEAVDWSLMQRLKNSKLTQEQLDELTISLPDGSSTTAGEFFYQEEALARLKIEQLEKAFEAGTHDLRELAATFAADESFIENVIAHEFKTTSSRLGDDYYKGAIAPLERFSKRENIVAHYDTPYQFTNIESLAGKPWQVKRDAIMEGAAKKGGTFITGELAYNYRVGFATSATQLAATTVLGAERTAKLLPLAAKAARTADSTGSGAGFLTSSNANYGDGLKMVAQDVGKNTHAWVTQAREDVASAFNTVSQKLIDNRVAGAEVGVVTNILRSDAGVFYKDLFNPKTLVHRDIGQIQQQIAALQASAPSQKIIEKIKGLQEKAAKVEADLTAAGARTKITVKEDDAWKFLETHQGLNGTRVNKEKVLIASRGNTSNKDPLAFYAPPINTNYFQHFAFVRGIEGKAFGTSEVAMVFGKNAEELQKRIALVDQSRFQVITKEAGERYHKAKGDYDFDLTLNERNIDSALRRSGVLADFSPEIRSENLIEDYIQFHANQESRVVRNAVENFYAQQVEELRYMGRNFIDDATSKFSGTTRAAKSEVFDPYLDIVKTMLDVSKRSEYKFFHQANEFVDALGTRAYAAWAEVTGKAQKGLISWEEAEKVAAQHGIGGLYSSESQLFESNLPRDRNLIKSTLARANTLLSRVVLQFDTAQALMNVISTPILLGTELASIRKLIGQDSELTGALNQLTRIAVPGTNGAQSVPSTTKLLANAVKNYFGDGGKELIKRYTENGDIKGISMLHHEAIESLSMSPNFKMFSDGIERASEKLTKWTGNSHAEEFTRFVSADVMRQLTEPLVQAGKMDLKAQNAYVSIFVNRVQGNYITSQRPILFQGVLGSAVSLFQTYQFNLMQQLLRHVGDKNTRAAATLFGMQNFMFGLNGLPAFDAINQHLIGNAAGNEKHKDVNTTVNGIFGKEMGDWLMYGTASAFPLFSDKAPALYTRGDINPRHISIIPITPGDVPAIDASIRFVKNLADMGKNIGNGAPIGESLLQGLEHNGLNRPLAGLAQVAMGHSTTSKGSLISANSDFSAIASASRVLGAKPMDEAVAMNYLFRQNAYKAADMERINALGERVRKSLVGNKVPSADDIDGWMRDYAAVGGRIEGFNSALARWMKDANTSVVNQTMKKVHSPYGRALQEVMGGETLQDYQNTPESE